MTEKTTSPTAPDAELAENIARFKRGLQARVVEIKRDLVQCLDQTTSSADYVEASKALLELAIERYLNIHDEEDAPPSRSISGPGSLRTLPCHCTAPSWSTTQTAVLARDTSSPMKTRMEASWSAG
jgi:hypothetical protein